MCRQIRYSKVAPLPLEEVGRGDVATRGGEGGFDAGSTTVGPLHCWRERDTGSVVCGTGSTSSATTAELPTRSDEDGPRSRAATPRLRRCHSRRWGRGAIAARGGEGGIVAGSTATATRPLDPTRMAAAGCQIHTSEPSPPPTTAGRSPINRRCKRQ